LRERAAREDIHAAVGSTALAFLFLVSPLAADFEDLAALVSASDMWEWLVGWRCRSISWCCAEAVFEEEKRTVTPQTLNSIGCQKLPETHF